MRTNDTEEQQIARKLAKQLTKENGKKYCQNLTEIRKAMQIERHNLKENTK